LRQNRQTPDIRINNLIRARELRVLSSDGENFGLLKTAEALKIARERDQDLIEISPNANPPVAKIMDFGKYQYDLKKKQKEAKAQARGSVETKNIQVKPATGTHDLELKSKTISKWLAEGHRVKLDLFLRGRAKYMDKEFLATRLDRVLAYLTVPYKIADPAKNSPKGLSIVIERDKANK
jgi:translation initiation factor IF-3